MNKPGEPIPGSCLCGTVRFKIDLPTRFCAHCHCDNCRRAHGAAFVTWFGVAGEQMRLVEGAATLQRYATATGARRSFCGRCGSTLFYEGPRWAGEVHVALANMLGPIDRKPDGHVYVDHRAAWWTIEDRLRRYGGKSGTEPLDSGETATEDS